MSRLLSSKRRYRSDDSVRCTLRSEREITSAGAIVQRPLLERAILDALGEKPLPLGNHLLSGNDWAGSLDLNDAETMHRFDKYVRAKK